MCATQPNTPKLRDQVHAVIRTKHYSIRTEKTYWHWIRCYIHFHGLRHPNEMAEPEVAAFLSWLATSRHVAASTQHQALNSLDGDSVTTPRSAQNDENLPRTE